MQTKIQIRLTPAEAADKNSILRAISASTGQNLGSITGYQILKKSIDARSRQQIWINLSLIGFINEPKEVSSQLHLISSLPMLKK